MSAFEQLNDAIQFHIVNSLGWRTLRPLQEQAIGPVLGGEHGILIAPTAGGKTEAAIFPLFSRMLDEDWQGVSILYLCPIKALLNNLEVRLDQYAQLVGRKIGVWHGDIDATARRRLIADRPDIILTTPESLEVMLLTRKASHNVLFANLRCIVVDEIHAFAGDDRGWHLLGVLERSAHLSRHCVQRIGLSATVGNPVQLIDWLAGSSTRPRAVVAIPDCADSPNLQIDYVGSIQNAAVVLSRLHRGEKRLVFCDSRARVEDIANELRVLGVTTFVSHSSLSLDERRQAEQAFSEGRNCVIVATSTLELGIDVGDLDRIVQIDAPQTVASFLQRLGRTGRRAGTIRNCLFLATSADSLVRACALMMLWERGYVEAIAPPALPYHVLAQQIIAQLLQTPATSAKTLKRALAPFATAAFGSTNPVDELVSHMEDQQFIHTDGGLLSVGSATERAFGVRNYMAIFSVFVSAPLIKVFHGARELGQVHEASFARKDDHPTILSLAGRSWQLVTLARAERRAFVEPASTKGRSRWLGGSCNTPLELSHAIYDVLIGKLLNKTTLSRRAKAILSQVREDFEWLQTSDTNLIEDDGRTSWWTFAGTQLNRVIADNLTVRVARVDDLALTFEKTVPQSEARRSIRELLARDVIHSMQTDLGRSEIKFSTALTDGQLHEMIRTRGHSQSDWKRFVSIKTTHS